MHFLSAKSASLGVFDREFRGKEQQEKPRVREFRELWITSLRGLGVSKMFWVLDFFIKFSISFDLYSVLSLVCAKIALVNFLLTLPKLH